MLSEATSEKVNLQKRLNELYQERKDLIRNIKTITRRKRLISDNLKQQALIGQRPEKINSAEELLQIRSSEQLEHHQHLNTKEDDIKLVVDSQNSIKERNKRLFGGLNIHLKKAEKRLREEEKKAKEKMNIEDKAVQKEREDTTKLQEERLRELDQQLGKLTVKREAIEEELLQTENIILKSKFVAYVSDQEHYLTTHTHPPLPWQPANFTPQLSQLLSQQTQQRKLQAEKVSEQIMTYNQRFNYFSYNLQNEKEYYNNLLDTYLTHRENFILTKTEPRLFWLPASSHNLPDLLNQSRTTLREVFFEREQEGSRRKQENDQYYSKFEKTAEVEQALDQNDSESH